MGVDRSTISKWETGDIAVNSNQLIKLAEIFNCSVDELLGLEKVNT